MEIVLAQPRGFCAGVKRAIEIVEKALEKYGSPVYVNHEIVHNGYVVRELNSKGAVFVKNLSEVPSGSIVIFSAHGVSLAIEQQAKELNLISIDATCPLVTKVHKQAQDYEYKRKKIILIGHSGHPEVDGTKGRVNSEVFLVQTIADIENLPINYDDELAYVTQTTLSLDDTKEIIEALKRKFKNIEGPGLKDICYATQNRQQAVKALAKIVEVILVIGANNSSNSNRLKDIAAQHGVNSYLINDEKDIDLSWFNQVTKVGLTAGASAPEILVNKVIDFMNYHFSAKVNSLEVVEERVIFKLPKLLDN